ncbi:hypothetical protein BDY21DRAFT_349208 [Lineolata rhizophorae]|uniref:PHD-type domain-containing protein n=1 Tax=Lineolata rhizophorae TaxID=578093 RepID=A0A6A6NWV3_9PEZI|nr:hypothetical protein BDY21DRAFT_349208 [Lineolata rhizophorae]
MADVHTLRTVADLSIDHGPQSSSRETSAPAAAASTADPVAKLTPTSSTTPANMPPKKRATASKPAVTKKGIAKAKPAPKKRKADEVATRNSGTPASRTSKTPAGGCNTKKSASGTPAAASPGAGDAAVAEGNDTDVGSVDSSGDVFCVCRRPDNHTWMIGCDGGCEDWFHGKCVNIREEDGDLIDKYICPNCTAEGKGNTTWKPMCRRDGCRKPARLRKGNPSKYCTDECGEMFFTARLGLPMDPVPNGASAEGNKKKPMKKKVTAILDDAEDDYLGPLGGALRPPEVKALTAAIPDFEAFRRLGEGVPSPPPTALPAEEDFYVTILDAESRERLDQIAAKKDELRVRRALLKDHDRFVTMTRERAARTAEREGLKPKDMCGYDAQLQWSEAEFSAWRASPIGRAALKLGTLEGEDFKQLAEQIRREEYGSLPTLNRSNGANSDPDGMEVDRDGPRDDGSPFSATPPPLCMRKRCERHKNWQKLALTDVRFEIVDVADAMRALEAEEKEIRQRAVLKWRAMTGSANRVDRASFSSTVTNGGEVEVVDA